MLNEGLRLQVAWDSRQSEEIRQTFQLRCLSQNDRFLPLLEEDGVQITFS